MPRHTFKTPAPQVKIQKPNYQNLMIIAVFVVGGFLIYRMISSVQRQLLVLKQDVSNLKDKEQKPKPPQIPSCGFEVSFQSSDAIAEGDLDDRDDRDDRDDDEASIDSVDIEKIMKKLTAPEEDNTVKSGSQFEDLGCDPQQDPGCGEGDSGGDSGDDSDNDSDSDGDNDGDNGGDNGGDVGYSDTASSEDAVDANDGKVRVEKEGHALGEDLGVPKKHSESTGKIVEIHEDLSKKSLADIKKMLKERGLPTKGNKAQLISALRHSLG